MDQYSGYSTCEQGNKNNRRKAELLLSLVIFLIIRVLLSPCI